MSPVEPNSEHLERKVEDNAMVVVEVENRCDTERQGTKMLDGHCEGVVFENVELSQWEGIVQRIQRLISICVV